MAQPRKRKRELSPIVSATIGTSFHIPRGRPLTSNYKYTALKTKTSIRILELRPGERLDALNCKLSIVEQKDAPSYEALSYAWGKPGAARVNVTCCRKKVSIPSNLRNALLNIRDRIHVKHLWADAICINQSDPQERGHQVKLMGSIYANAERVLIWLGDYEFDHHESDDEMDNEVDHVDAFTALAFQCFPELEDGDNEALERCKARLADMNDATYSFCAAFARLTHQPYFQRLWVVQEVGLAKHAVALLGAVKVPFGNILASLLFMKEMCLAEKFGMVLSVRKAFLSFPASWKHQNGMEDEELNFGDLLWDTMRQEASDPHDYIYALLGHPSALLNGQLIVEPDYEKDPSTVFHEVALKIINHTSSIDILSRVHHVPGISPRDDLPSWVPTWERDSTLEPIVFFRGANWEECTRRPLSVTFGDSGKSISIRGFIVDYVEECTEAVHSWDPKQFLERKDPFALWPIEQVLEFKSRNEFPRHEALSDLCSLMLESAALRDTWSSFECQAIEVEMMEQIAEVANSGLPSTVTSCSYPKDRIPEDVIRDALAVIHGRLVFSTRTGMVGLGPAVARPGDVCCIFFDSTIPYILRPVGSRYRLLGAAHVHGIMEGQAIMEFELAGTYEEQTFDIF